MALSAATLDFISSQTDTNSYASSQSHTPAANSMLVATIVTTQASGAVPPTPTSVTGWGLTWELIYGPDNYDVSGTTATLTVYAALQGGSPSSGNLSVSLSGTSTSGCAIIDNITGLTGSSTAAGYFQQTSSISTGTSTSGTATLSAFGSANNMGYAFAAEFNNEDLTAGSGLTLLDSRHHPSPSIGYATEWKLNTTSLGFSWATGGTYGVIAHEIGAEAVVDLTGDTSSGVGTASAAALTGDIFLLTDSAAGIGVASDAALSVGTAAGVGIRAAPQFVVLVGDDALQPTRPTISMAGFNHDVSDDAVSPLRTVATLVSRTHFVNNGGGPPANPTVVILSATGRMPNWTVTGTKASLALVGTMPNLRGVGVKAAAKTANGQKEVLGARGSMPVRTATGSVEH